MGRNALACQWISHHDVKLPRAPEQLCLADSDPDFRHIALIELNRGMDLLTLESQLNSKARGAIVIHWCNQLPSDDPRVNAAFIKASIPVVLIRKSSGIRLVNDLSDSSQTILVKFVNEALTDAGLPDYDRDSSFVVAEAADPKSRQRSFGLFGPKLHFHLRRRLHKCLFDQQMKACVIHKDTSLMCDIFQLFDDFDQRVH